MEGKGEMVAEAEIERLPVDLLAHIFSLLSSFLDLAQASGVCRRWRRGVEQSLASRERLSFSGRKMDDASTARLVCAACNLKELDISRSCWGCQITDEGLYKISFAKCVSNLTSISLWGMAGITDRGVIQLVSRAMSLQNLNIGGTFITDESLYAIANSCPRLKVHRLGIGAVLPSVLKQCQYARYEGWFGILTLGVPLVLSFGSVPVWYGGMKRYAPVR